VPTLLGGKEEGVGRRALPQLLDGEHEGVRDVGRQTPPPPLEDESEGVALADGLGGEHEGVAPLWALAAGLAALAAACHTAGLPTSAPSQLGLRQPHRPTLLLVCLGWLVASADGAGAALPDSPQDLDQLIAAAGGATVLLSALLERLGLSAAIVAPVFEIYR